MVNVRRKAGDAGLEGVCGALNPHPFGWEEVNGVGVGGPVDLVRRRKIREL